jgi:hypothetical protein
MWLALQSKSNVGFAEIGKSSIDCREDYLLVRGSLIKQSFREHLRDAPGGCDSAIIRQPDAP